MAGIVNSTFLDYVLDLAQKSFGDDKVTAEKAAAIVFDMVARDAKDIPELEDIKKIVQNRGLDAELVHAALKEYIDSSLNAESADGIYMQKIMLMAKTKATFSGKEELTATDFFNCLLEFPSKPISGALKKAKSAGQDIVSGLSVEELLGKAGQVVSSVLSKTAGEKNDDGADDIISTTDTVAPEKAPSQKDEMDALVSDVKRVRGELKGKIFGQDHAINVFATGYFQGKMLSMIDKSRKRPRATFLFAGPPGVGKTFLAEMAAQSLGLPFMRFDMSEYSTKEASIEFCGSDKVYKNGAEGNVTGFVNKNPECVLLFDEIEKAHISVIHLFLQMLDAGRLRDNFTDIEVPFTNTIIIMTTNAGRSLYKDSDTTDFSGVSRKVIIKALQEDINPETQVPFFPSALCSRFASANVIMFNHIGADFLCTIAEKEIGRQVKNLKNETGINISVEEGVYSALLFSEGGAADARTVRGRAEAFFNDELYELFRFVASEKTATGISDLENIKITLDIATASEDVRELFEAAEKPQILVFANETVVNKCERLLPDAEVLCADTLDGAVEVIKGNNLSFVLIDMKCGTGKSAADILNIEDKVSPARDFLKFLNAGTRSIPVYLLDDGITVLDEEEKISLLKHGVRRVFPYTDKSFDFSGEVKKLVSALHQQSNLSKLASANKLVSFETAQCLSKDGKDAEIRLFDFKTAVALDASDAKNVLSAVSRPTVKFDEVLGAADAKRELTYFVEYLKNPKKYMGTGVKAPKGVLLYGPPGTGKTMLAKAMASEADVTFIASQGNEFLKKYVGEGPERVHELFRIARKYAPSILFIDEIDAIAKERIGGMEGTAGIEATLTAFLTEMDGFDVDATRPVFVLAATNFDVKPGTPKSLDAALMRRFDRKIYIDLPLREDRIKFIRLKMAKNQAFCLSDEMVENIAMRSTGMSLSVLDSVIELALRSAIREGSTVVTDAIFEDAFETTVSGEVKKWDASQLQRVARHEAGHALICYLGGETPSYLTVVARGNHGGYMQHADKEGKAIYTKDELLANIRTSLGGRAAEIVCYGERDGISTGASGDLASATSLAMQMVCTYGMDESVGLAVFDGEMTADLRKAVNAILDEQMAQAIRIISENRGKLDALVKALEEKNRLSGKEIEALLK